MFTDSVDWIVCLLSASANLALAFTFNFLFEKSLIPNGLIQIPKLSFRTVKNGHLLLTMMLMLLLLLLLLLVLLLKLLLLLLMMMMMM